MDLEVRVDALDIVEDLENFGGALVDVERVEAGVLPLVIVRVRCATIRGRSLRTKTS